MANDESVLKEVDNELAEERQWAMFRKYGPAAIGAGLAVVLAVGAWQFWTARQSAVAKKEALEYREAIAQLEENPIEGRAALDAIFEEKGSGYSTLAQFRRAASYAAEGERTAAIVAYQKIYEDGAAPKRLRELARVRAGYLALDDGRAAVLTHLGELRESESALSFHATEIAGLAAIEARDYETALSIFRGLSIDIGAPAAIRTRAEEFAALADAGKAGVNISGETRIDDILSVIGEDAVDAHAGHDHEAAEEADESAAEAVEATPTETAPADPAESGNE